MNRKIMDIFRRDILKKILALLVAFFMWIYVMDINDPIINGSYELPFTLSKVSENLFPMCEIQKVRIFTRAPRSHFAKYTDNAFRVYADLEGIGVGEHEIVPQVIMPQGFELIEIDPPKFNVKLDPIIERQLPIEIVTNGSIAQDVVIKKLEKSMDVIMVFGPKSFVEQVEHVYGDLNFSNNDSDFEIPVQPEVVDKFRKPVPNLRVIPNIITVSVKMETGIKKKIVPIIAELFTDPGWEITNIDVEPAQIEISGTEPVINSIVTLKTEKFYLPPEETEFFSQKLKLIIPEEITTDRTEVIVTADLKPGTSAENEVNNK